MTKVLTEGNSETINDRHSGGFAFTLGLNQKNGGFGLRFNAKDYDGDSPTYENLEAIEKQETNCKNVPIKAYETFVVFREIKHNKVDTE